MYYILGVIVVVVLPLAEASNASDDENGKEEYIENKYLDLMLRIMRSVLNVQYPRDKNIFISPSLMASPMALLSHATIGETLHQIALTFMGHGLGPKIYKNLGDLQARVKTATPRSHDDGLAIINHFALRKRENTTLKESFLHLADEYYKVPIVHGIKGQNVESYGGDDDPIVDKLKHLKILLSSGYNFRVKWETMFSPHGKYKALFSISPEERIMTEFMSARDFHPAWYDSVTDSTILELPLYPSNSDVSFMILCPKTAFGLDYLEKLLVSQHLRSILTNPNREKKTAVAYSIPRVKFHNEIDAVRVWEHLGVKKIFEPGCEEITGIDDLNDLHVSHFHHSASIEFDEFGGNDESVGTERDSTENAISVVLDHPFLFMIIHKPTHSVHAYGRILRPDGATLVKDEL